MAKQLNSTVWVRNESGDGGDMFVSFGPDSESIPKWAAEQIGPHCYEQTDGDSAEEPPRIGKGSGKEAWADFATEHDVEVTKDDTRDDIIAKLAAAGVVEA